MKKKKPLKRKKAKIELPPDLDGNKDSIQAFRTSDSMKAKLSLEDNKSEVINQALMEYYNKNKLVECPTCKGKGKIRLK